MHLYSYVVYMCDCVLLGGKMGLQVDMITTYYDL
jgi:hypothetical protein